MTVVRELVATFELDVDAKSFDKAERSIDGVIRGAKILGGLFAGGILAAGFKQVIDLASNATEDINLLQVAFGERLTPTILEWAGQTARAVNQSEFELRRFVGTTQAMLAPMLGGADAAARFSTQIVEAAIDLESLLNVPLPQAFRKIQSAIANQSRPLLDLGIDTRDLAFNQFLMAKGIANSSAELEGAQLQTQRLNFILEQLAFTQGDAAKTANDFKNVQRGITAGLKDITTRIGQLFLPAMTRTSIVTRKAVVAVRDWIEQNDEWLQQNIGGAFSKLVQVVDNVVKGVAQAVKFFAKLVDRMPPLAKGILAAVTAIGALIAILALPGAPFIALLALIALIIDDFVVFGEGGKSVIGDLVNAIDGLVREFFGLTDSAKGTFEIITGAMDGFLGSARNTLSAVGRFFSDTWTFIKSSAKIAWTFVRNLFTGGGESGAMASMQIADAFGTAWDTIKETTASLWESLKTTFQEGFKVIGEFLDDTFDIDTAGAIADLERFITRARNVIAGLLRNPVVKLLLRLVAAKLGAAAGEFVGEGVGELFNAIIPKNRATKALGLDKVGDAITKFVTGKVGAVAGGITGLVASGDLIDALADQIQTTPAGAPVPQLPSNIEQILSGFGPLASQIETAGVGGFAQLTAPAGAGTVLTDNSRINATITLQQQIGQSARAAAEMIPVALRAMRDETQKELRGAMESFVPATK